MRGCSVTLWRCNAVQYSTVYSCALRVTESQNCVSMCSRLILLYSTVATKWTWTTQRAHALNIAYAIARMDKLLSDS